MVYISWIALAIIRTTGVLYAKAVCEMSAMHNHLCLRTLGLYRVRSL